MCTPMAILGMQAAGAASSTVGSFYAAQAQKSQLQLRADLAEIDARSALLAGEREQQRARLAAANLKGRQRAAMAANGVALDSGTPANVLTSTDVLGEIDANTIESNAIRQAWGYRTEATMDRARAGAINPMLSAASTLLGGATQIASSWYQFDKAGAFDKPMGGDGLSQGDRRKIGVW